MYAVIQTGGKQYRVEPGTIVQIEKLEGEKGTSVQFKEVLMVSGGQADSAEIFVGAPLLSNALVQAEVIGQGRGEKIRIVKHKQRKHFRKSMGHRQFQTQVLVTSVDSGQGKKAELSSADKTKILKSFHTSLKPKGEAFTPKTLGSRKKMAKAASEGKTEKKAAAKKPAAKKAPAKKKAAAK